MQKVLGAVRMQQQRSCSNPTICKRTMSAVEQFAAGLGSDAQSVKQLSQRIAKAENAEAIAQQAVRALQKKEAAWEVELGAAQTSNAQLHKQVPVNTLSSKLVLSTAVGLPPSMGSHQNLAICQLHTCSVSLADICKHERDVCVLELH